MYFSIILPSYNSADILNKNLPILLEYLNAQKYQWEIIVVDDGSNDKGETEKVAKKFACIYEKNPENMGKGAAVRRGMLRGKGRFRIFTDADLPFQTEVFERFLHYLDFKEFDMVVGDRTLEDSNYFSEISQSRKFGSNVFSFIVGRFITTGLFDTQCGIKGFRDSIVNDIFSVSRINGFAFDVEIIYLALKRNYDIKRLPVRLRNQEGTSVSLLRHSAFMIYDLFRIKINHLTRRYKKQILNQTNSNISEKK